MILPTLTIMQPYASLLANGKKRFETRYRRTSKRGLVAIHAGRGQYAPPTDEAQEKYFELIRQSKELTGISFPCLPRGYIVGVAQLVACEYIIDANEERAILTDKRNPESGVMEIRGEELQFGDFRKGRYGKPLAYQLDLFGPYSVEVSRDYKFAEGLLAVMGEAMVGGNVITSNGFIRVKKA